MRCAACDRTESDRLFPVLFAEFKDPFSTQPLALVPVSEGNAGRMFGVGMGMFLWIPLGHPLRQLGAPYELVLAVVALAVPAGCGLGLSAGGWLDRYWLRVRRRRQELALVKRERRLELRAESGDVVAMYELGCLALQDSESPESATNLFGRAAEAGHPPAMSRYAALLERGAAPTDDAEILRWYRRAADEGDTRGMVGVARRQGKAPAERGIALNMLRNAAVLDDLEGVVRYARAVEQAGDTEEAYRWYGRGVPYP